MKRLAVLCLGLTIAVPTFVAPTTAAPMTKGLGVRERAPSSVLEAIQQNAELLPANVTITPVNEQNALIVTGEPDAISQVEALVRQFDKAPPQVEVEVRFVLIDRQVFNTLKLNSSGTSSATNPLVSSANQQLTVALAKPGVIRTLVPAALNTNFFTTLEQHVKAKRAELVSIPRVSPLDGQEASIHQTQEIQVGEELKVAGITGLIAQPKVDKDGNITLVMRPVGRLGVGPSASFPVIQTSEPITILPKDKNVFLPSELTVTVANLRDGDTVAIGGALAEQFESLLSTSDWLRVPDALFKPDTPPAMERELVLFVTPRLIKRVQDVTEPKVASLPE